MTNILDMIDGGQLDADLDVIVEAIAVRRKVVNMKVLRDLRPGDTVAFNGKVRPGYLEGVRCTVLRKKQTRVMVRIEDECGYARFPKGAEITTPLSIVDVIPADAAVTS